MKNSRRTFVKQSIAAAGIASIPGPFDAVEKKLKIVCVGAHPDDPESGCGGSLAKFAAEGHETTIIYLTQGEAGIPGKSSSEAASIRRSEAEKSCTVLQAKALFAGQVDGATLINSEWINRFHQLLQSEKPHIVFTHWPVDTHQDHQVASMLTWRSWLKSNKHFDLYFYEVCAGEQSMIFYPNTYIDITATQEIKKKAIYCHTSQDPAGIYACGHADMEVFRGRECGVKVAEAFIKVNAPLTL
jgi:LmbE family N-acetylglucosaminyl deacetylase